MLIAPDRTPVVPETPRWRCIACGGREPARVYRGLPWLSRCRACGLGFIFPQPSDAELQAIYDDRYYETFGHRDDGHGYHDLKRAWADEFMGSIDPGMGPGRLLDVGSALGDLLYVARRRGWAVACVEPNPFAAERSGALVPGAVVASAIEDYEAADEMFDLVTCNDVLEHLRRPDLVLSRLFRLLRPGGRLALTTVDMGGLAARLSGRRWVHYHRDHLWYFTRRTLTRLAEAAGFRVIDCRAARKLYHLDYLLNVIARHRTFPTAARCAGLALRTLPAETTFRRFPLKEGLLLLACRST